MVVVFSIWCNSGTINLIIRINVASDVDLVDLLHRQCATSKLTEV